jgi:hypothetical protein
VGTVKTIVDTNAGDVVAFSSMAVTFISMGDPAVFGVTNKLSGVDSAF